MMGFITWIFPLAVLLLLGLMAYCQICILEELRALRRGLGQKDLAAEDIEEKQ